MLTFCLYSRVKFDPFWVKNLLVKMIKQDLTNTTYCKILEWVYYAFSFLAAELTFKFKCSGKN